MTTDAGGDVRNATRGGDEDVTTADRRDDNRTAGRAEPARIDDGPRPMDDHDRAGGADPAGGRAGDPAVGGAPAGDRAGGGDRPMGERERRMAGSDRGPEGGRDDGTTLIEPGRAREYQDRWQSVKGDFVDEPRRAVQDANALVGEVLDDLENLFRSQRERLERDLDDADASTEDLRLALNRYRSFFDRLLSL